VRVTVVDQGRSEPESTVRSDCATNPGTDLPFEARGKKVGHYETMRTAYPSLALRASRENRGWKRE